MSTAEGQDNEWFEEYYFTCIEDALDEVDIYGAVERLSEGLGQLPEWVGDLVCVHRLLGEYQNGGLMQFFINSTGILAPEAVAALRRMRLSQAAEALNLAVALFGSSYPRNKEDRCRILRAKAGLKFEDMEIQMWRAKLFERMEETLAAVGDRNIFDRMNAYAEEHADQTPA